MMIPRHAETEIKPGRDERLGCQPIRKLGGNASRVKTDKRTPNELKLRWVFLGTVHGCRPNFAARL